MLFYLFLTEVWHCPLKPRRCLTSIYMRTGTDTSLMIGDDKITYSRTSMSSQTMRKKHSTCHQNEGVRGCTCSASVYKAASSLAECKTGCAIPVFIHVLGPFELKKMQVLLQHMSQVNCNFALCKRRFLFFPRHVAPGTESGSSMSKSITTFGEQDNI